MEDFRTLIEPFRIHSVQPLHMTTRAHREACLKEAGYNLFALRSDDVMVDLLTDSGTGAMSSEQWAAMHRGDESYAGSPSFERFRAAVKAYFPFRHIIPTHQGRAAEKILFHVIGSPGKLVPSNAHFDTTRANIEATGMRAVDLPIREGQQPSLQHPFKGNMDVQRLERLFSEEKTGHIPLVMLTLTNNACGGQPVSIENISAVRQVCKQHAVPLFFDACRFAENAWFIREREMAHQGRAVGDIVRHMMAHADGVTMSAKKDGLANIGGWLALNDDAWAELACNALILTEGFPTYGGLAGRDLDAIAQGLTEVTQHDYLHYRVQSTKYLGEALGRLGIPLVQPIGGHAVFVDARALLPHIPPLQYPGHALATALYVEGGVRGCEIGTVMFGRTQGEVETAAAMDLVRLALPRRTYTQNHMDYVVEVAERVLQRKHTLVGFRIVRQSPRLRHFSATFAPLELQRPE